MNEQPKLKAKLVLSVFILGMSLIPDNGHATDQIIRPFSSIRSQGMGGTRTTTGLYEENFFGNPALVTENPKNRFQIFDFYFELSASTISNAQTILKNMDDSINALSETSGSNNHTRIQMAWPAIYFPNRGKMSYAFGLLTSIQSDVIIRKSYRVDPLSVIDIGPALTVGRKLGINDEWSLGATVHTSYRLSSKTSSFTLIDFLQGVSISPAQTGGDGGMIDASFGAYYKIPYAWENWKLASGFSVNNILGGNYNLFSLNLAQGGLPRSQPRSLNVGVSATKDVIGDFFQNRIALEFNNIGLNSGGSIFRLIHMGGETRYGVVKFRGGFNQGYLAAGLGIETKVFSFDLATYGEEMSLNVGNQQDRRYALRFAFQI